MSPTTEDPRQTVADLVAAADRQRRDESDAAVDEAAILSAFESLAPSGAVGDTGVATVLRFNETTHVDVNVPTGSQLPLVGLVKKVLRKLQSWYLRYVTDQVNLSLGLAGEVLENHEDRLGRLDTLVEPDAIGLIPSPPLTHGVAERVLAVLADQLGANSGSRTLMAWSGHGEILDGARDAGYDAYGVDAASDLVASCIRMGIDVRHDDPIAHLDALPEGQLGAVVLGQAIDTLPLAQIARVVDAARRAISSDGAVVVLADTGPVDSVRFELAGRPALSAAAWGVVLAARRLTCKSTSVSDGGITVIVAGR